MRRIIKRYFDKTISSVFCGIQVAEMLAEKFKVTINAEVAFGAMTENEISVLNEIMVKSYAIPKK